MTMYLFSLFIRAGLGVKFLCIIICKFNFCVDILLTFFMLMKGFFVYVFLSRTSIPEPPSNTESIELTKTTASKESSVVSGMCPALWSHTQPSRCGVPSGYLCSARRESKTSLNLAQWTSVISLPHWYSLWFRKVSSLSALHSSLSCWWTISSILRF